MLKRNRMQLINGGGGGGGGKHLVYRTQKLHIDETNGYFDISI